MHKTIGLLTLDSHNSNYGGLLQAYALQQVIHSLGYTCEIIDYIRSTERATFSVKRDIRNLTLKKCFDRIIWLTTKENYNPKVKAIDARRIAKCDVFRDSYMKLSSPCTREELPQLGIRYDAIVCGSDQIWNPSFNLPSFFLDFVPDSVGKVIYAASIGRDELSHREREVYAQYLKPLHWISVRESGAKKIVEQIAEDKAIKLVLDPTLLLETSHWEQIAGAERLVQQKYVFCYFLGIDEQKKNAALEFASHHGWKIISIPYLHSRYERLDEDFSAEELDVGPAEFLNLIRHAEFVLTDSFHASVFSILFQKEFRVFGRTWENGDMNTRIHTLLGYIGRIDYLIEPAQLKQSTASEGSTWCLDKLQILRTESLQWLRTSLTDAETGFQSIKGQV